MRLSNPFSALSRKTALAFAILLGFACGPGPSDINEFMSFFMPESSNAKPQDQLYFFSPQIYNTPETGSPAETDSLVVDESTQAWAVYLNNALPVPDIRQSLYGGSTTSALSRYLQTNNAPAHAYLTFLHDTQQAAPASEDPWTPANADTTRLTALLEQAKTAYASAADPFLKERYGFQAVKLADQIGDPAQSQTLYDQFIKPLAKKSYVSDWALCRRAGASLALGDTARAIYEFAQVFDRCPSRRREAEASLRIHGLHFTEKALGLAQTDQEKAAVYALCAIQPKQDALSFLEEIVKLTPQNPLIELIFAREINRNEYYFFAEGNPVYAYDESSRNDSIAFVKRRTETDSYIDKLKTFALDAAGNKQLSQQNAGSPAFFLTAAAYLDYLRKDYASARKTLEQAEQTPTSNEALKKQIVLQQMLLLAAQTDKITPEVESKLIGYLERFGKSTSFRLNNAFVRTCQQFAGRYKGSATGESSSWGWLTSCMGSKKADASDADVAKAFLLTMLTTHELATDQGYFMNNTDQLIIEDSTSAATAQKVVAFATQPSATDFDKRLLKLTGFDNDYLYAFLGRRLMAAQQYNAAAEAFARVSEKTWKDEAFTLYFDTNPFTINLPDEKTGNPYTPVTFARRMAELETQAKQASGDRAAELYYQLGCGAYNLSWHGNAWLLVHRYRSSAEPNVYIYMPYGGQTDRIGLERLADDNYYTTAAAQRYFAQSAKAAQNPELAARSLYMTARCEEHAFLARKAVEQAKRGFDADPEPFNKSMDSLRQGGYVTYFNQYRQQYTKSRFHADMVRECALYSAFLAGETAHAGE
nr:hypothetical protein [uncultured Arsenicibacter sp.]